MGEAIGSGVNTGVGVNGIAVVIADVDVHGGVDVYTGASEVVSGVGAAVWETARGRMRGSHTTGLRECQLNHISGSAVQLDLRGA